MKTPASDVAFTASVKEQQRRRGSRADFERVEAGAGWPATITPDLKTFVANVRSFYLGTASSDGQPYIQHRGGPAGFLRPLDDKTLAFADFAGNRQYVTAGHLAENPRAFLFLMDYARQRRIKIWGTAAIVENDAALLAQLSEPSYRAQPERAIVFTVAAWDRNCAQHIPRLVPLADVAAAISGLERRIAELEAENARYRDNV